MHIMYMQAKCMYIIFIYTLYMYVPDRVNYLEINKYVRNTKTENVRSLWK